MADIKVERPGPEVYRVELTVDGKTTLHEVGASDADVERLGGGAPGEKLVEEAFRFLLEREPREKIAPSFHILLIARYHMEFLEEFPDRMTRRAE